MPDLHHYNILLTQAQYRVLREMAFKEETTIAAVIRAILNGERPPLPKVVTPTR